MKEFLTKLIETKQQEIVALKEQSNKSEDINEVRSIGTKLASLTDEIKAAEEQLAKLEEQRNFNPLATYGTNSVEKKQAEENYLDSMEYRSAFAKYVKTGKWEFRDATAGMVTTGDIGKVIPNTIMNELIKELKDYGRLYSKVRKINVQGGVEFPIEELVPTVSWITETQPSSNQAVPKIKTSIVFGYHVAEARIAQSLLSSIVSLPVLESEIAKLLAEAFVKEFDRK